MSTLSTMFCFAVCNKLLRFTVECCHHFRPSSSHCRCACSSKALLRWHLTCHFPLFLVQLYNWFKKMLSAHTKTGQRQQRSLTEDKKHPLQWSCPWVWFQDERRRLLCRKRLIKLALRQAPLGRAVDLAMNCSLTNPAGKIPSKLSLSHELAQQQDAAKPLLLGIHICLERGLDGLLRDASSKHSTK